MVGRPAWRRTHSHRNARQDPRDVLDTLIEQLGDPAALQSSVCEQVRNLESVVERRFDAEERSDRYEEVLGESPWLTGAAQALLQQHVELRSVLRYLNRIANSSSTDDAWRQRLRDAVSDFAEQYVVHEISEENLLQDAYRAPSWVSDR